MMMDLPATIDRQRYRRITGFFASVLAHVIWWDIVLRRLSTLDVFRAPGRPDGARSRAAFASLQLKWVVFSLSWANS
jgi:hypothetical protein